MFICLLVREITRIIKMTRFAVVVALLVAFAVVAQGFPTRENDIASAAAAGDWDEVHRLLNNYYNKKYGLMSLSSTGDLRSLKPQKGGHVFGESEITFHSAATDEKGRTHEQSGGHKLINDDGKVMEFDFKPQYQKPLY